MEKHKIEDFKNDFKDQPVPYIKEIENMQKSILKNGIILKFNIKNYRNEFDLMTQISKLMSHFRDEIVYIDDIKLDDILIQLNIASSDKVFLNWDYFQNVDEMYYEDLNRYLLDFWYPGADDLDIIDYNLNWIINIDHNGIIRYKIF